MQTDAARSAGMDKHIRLIAWMAPAEPPIATTRRKPSLILSPSPSGRALARCLSGAAGATGSSRLPVDARSGEPGQKLVGFDLLLQRLVEEVRGLFHAKFVGPGLERPVAGDFIVLHGLPGSDERRIERVGALELVHEFLGLVDDAEDRLAGLAARGLSHLLENLVEALDVLFGRVAMGLESVLELRRHRLLGHFRQGSQNLLLREIDVLQRLGEKILERIGGLHLCHFLSAPMLRRSENGFMRDMFLSSGAQADRAFSSRLDAAREGAAVRGLSGAAPRADADRRGRTLHGSGRADLAAMQPFQRLRRRNLSKRQNATAKEATNASRHRLRRGCGARAREHGW